MDNQSNKIKIEDFKILLTELVKSGKITEQARIDIETDCAWVLNGEGEDALQELMQGYIEKFEV